MNIRIYHIIEIVYDKNVIDSFKKFYKIWKKIRAYNW